MDAQRKGRAKEYIPEDLIPKDPNGGGLMRPNSFDHCYIKIAGGFSEDESGKSKLYNRISHMTVTLLLM